MPVTSKNRKWWGREREGSLLIDALLAVAIFGAIVAAFSSGIMQGQLGTIYGSERIRATYLATEGLQAVRWIRDQENAIGENTGYDAIAALATGVDHGVTTVNGVWTLRANTPSVIDTVFTRKIRLTVGNNANERIVQSTVTWTGIKNLGARGITMTSVLTKWPKDPPPPPPDWSQPVVVGSLTNVAFDEPSLEKVAVSGNYAFIAASQNYIGLFDLFIVNISDFGALSIVNSVDLPVDGAYDIALYGNYAYLATEDTNNEIKIVNIETPATATCCAGAIDLPDSGYPKGITVVGSHLYVARQSSGGAEILIYDVGSNQTAPPLLSSYDTGGGGESFYAITASGSNPLTRYVHVASGISSGNEYRMISMTGSTQVGDGDAGSNILGTAIAVFNGAAYVGVKGGDPCELFSFNIFNPNVVLSCGGGGAYGLGGGNDAGESPNDMELQTKNNLPQPTLFMASNSKDSLNVNRYLHILDVSDPSNINSIPKRLYDGNITAGFSVDHGIAYRLSDHTIFMVGGDAGDTSHLLILQPTYSY